MPAWTVVVHLPGQHERFPDLDLCRRFMHTEDTHSTRRGEFSYARFAAGCIHVVGRGGCEVGASQPAAHPQLEPGLCAALRVPWRGRLPIDTLPRGVAG